MLWILDYMKLLLIFLGVIMLLRLYISVFIHVE